MKKQEDEIFYGFLRGRPISFPDDMSYKACRKYYDWLEANGETAPEYVPPVPSTDPRDYPLTQKQFMSMLEIAGISEASVHAAIDKIPDPVKRAEVRSDFKLSTTYHRGNPLYDQLAKDVGTTPEEISTAWMAAKDLHQS